jgi:hypothetical protein
MSGLILDSGQERTKGMRNSTVPREDGTGNEQK